MMKFSRLLFVLAYLVSIFVCLASSLDESTLYNTCSGANYTSNSIYQKNLNSLLSSLSSNNDIDYGFYNFSEGEGIDRVNAIALCRGDVSQTACRRCVNFSTTDLPKRCPTQKEPTIWYDNCMLRYSNKSIFRTWGDPAVHLWNVNNVSDVNLFSQALDGLLSDLREKASMGDSRVKFAIGNTNYANFTRIYGLVQCTPDLTEVECSNCLDRSFRDITNAFPGKQGGRVIGPSCNFRYEINQFYEIPSPPSLPASPPPAFAPPPPTATEIVPQTGWSNKVRNIIISVVATVCFVILIISIFVFLRLMKRKKKLDSVDEIGSADVLQLDFETVKAATDNFSNDNKLGQGGFGSVYKGKLADGQKIAVKRLATGSRQGDLEFKNEVVLVAKLQHRNLVRLLGFCLEGQERLLIYEFVANASLDKFLFDPYRRSYLDWERRYKIIGGVARGLLYLHEDSRLRIIHRDLKASNVLLDEQMHPKIADFGMARLCIMDQTQGNTNRIAGTFGYMAPESVRGQFSVKLDVYSFGVLLLELVSGQKNSCFQVGETAEDLIRFAWDSWRAETAAKMIDPVIINGPRNEILRCIHIGLLCVQESVTTRPTMASVVTMLNSFLVALPPPSEPAFYMHMEAERPMLAGSSNSKCIFSNFSKNEVSITEMEPR
ncbi:hypothetical protein QQ045_010943 [Rhodiola kirilowii]